MYRQGDVLIVPVAKAPENLEPLEREGGRVILAHGEATGHAHAIAEPGAVLFSETATGRRFLKLLKPAALDHEEHDRIDLPTGDYEVIRQKEYDYMEGWRYVAD